MTLEAIKGKILSVNYIVAEISGRQYKVAPGKTLWVDFLGTDIKELECDKVLLSSNGDKVEVGTPYLKEKVKFEVLSSKRERKIRVAKFHAKANYRRVRGSRRALSEIRLVTK